MSATLDTTVRGLSGCGCCQGVSVSTPVGTSNRPGLSAVAYRAGTHSQFRGSLLARLSLSAHPSLRKFTTRENDDFTVALLDAWSAVADVLTFYQERVANEAFLRTATERLSVLEMARLIGYRLDPGVAANVYLAFEIESAEGAFGQALSAANKVQAATPLPPVVTIEAGVKVQTIPGPGEDPQTFETVETIQAHSELNAIKPRLDNHDPFSNVPKSIFVKGTDLNLNKGDLILIQRPEEPDVTEVVKKVTLDQDRKTTRLDFSDPPPAIARLAAVTDAVTTIDDFLEQFDTASGQAALPLDADVIGKIIEARWRLEDLNSLIDLQGWDREKLLRNLRDQVSGEQANATIYVFRQRTKVFGYNAPRIVSYDTRPPLPDLPGDWDEWTTESASSPPSSAELANRIFLAEANDAIMPKSYVAIDTGSGATTVHKIGSVRIRPRTAYGISGETTELSLDSEWWTPEFGLVRSTVVYAESEKLEVAPVLIEDDIKPEPKTPAAGELETEPVFTTQIILDKAYLGLKSGQTIILTGPRTDLKGVTTSEVLTIKEARLERGYTVLEFNENLKGTYQRDKVTLNANVAAATHGETVQEILGSGDASQRFQRFTLKQPPLTYVSAATASGSKSTLEVRVNDILWEEVDSFFGRSAGERVYVTEQTDEGSTIVIFGDGINGTRLPTGQANVTARYRKGIGLGGLVKPGQASQLMTRPLGVKSAVNPLASEGAEDADELEQARQNAPITVLTLDRIVSLRDYEDFARSYTGIDKAMATWVWMGESRGVFLTVAGPAGAEIGEGSKTLESVVGAIRLHGDARAPFVVRSYRPRLFRVQGKVKLEPDRLVAAVAPEIERTLRDRFSFQARAFGQPVAVSEVIAIIHGVAGVKWVDIDALYYSEAAAAWNAILGADFPKQGTEELLAAELLMLDPAPLELEVSL